MSRRKRTYFLLMGVCVGLFLLSGLVVRHFSEPAAVAMAVLAMCIPPVAVIIANRPRG